MAITKRLVKGSALTHTELDSNFTDLDGRITTLENTADSDGQTLTLAGDNLTISGGNTIDLSTINSTGILNVVEDTSPQLGGNLDLNGNSITGSGGSAIGEVLNVLTLVGGSNGIIMRAGGNIVIGDQAQDIVLGNSSQKVEFVNGVDVDFTNTNVDFTSATVTGLSIVQGIDDLSDVDTSTTPPGVGQVLKWDGAQWEPANDSSGSGGITLTALSVVSASASASPSLVYNNTTGVFTYTPPDLSSYLTSVPAQTFASLTGTPTTIAGYGITDALALGTTSTTALAGDTALFDSTTSEVAIGAAAGQTNQGTESIAIGDDAGNSDQGNYAVAIGDQAGRVGQGENAVAIGEEAGEIFQGSYTVAIGNDAGKSNQQTLAVAIGAYAGRSTQATKSVAIGNLAGNDTQGASAVAIGASAGQNNQAANSIVINATGVETNNTTASSFVVKPVRNASGTHQLEYDPTTGEVTYDTLGGGGGLPSRSTATGTTSSLADAAQADLDITGFKSYTLLTITTDKAARVRLYVNAATRTADAARAEGTDPAADAGLIAEVITTGAETVIISPGAYGFNLESSPTTNIPCRVTNKSGSTGTVQIDLNILQLEA